MTSMNPAGPHPIRSRRPLDMVQEYSFSSSTPHLIPCDASTISRFQLEKPHRHQEKRGSLRYYSITRMKKMDKWIKHSSSAKIKTTKSKRTCIDKWLKKITSGWMLSGAKYFLVSTQTENCITGEIFVSQVGSVDDKREPHLRNTTEHSRDISWSVSQVDGMSSN